MKKLAVHYAGGGERWLLGTLADSGRPGRASVLTADWQRVRAD